MKKILLNLAYFLAVFLLNGCGQMGPLYLPNQKPPVYVPHSSSNWVH